MGVKELAIGISIAKLLSEEKKKKEEKRELVPVIINRSNFYESNVVLVNESGEGVLKEASIITDSSDLIIRLVVDGNTIVRKFSELSNMTTAVEYFMVEETAEGYYAVHFTEIVFRSNLTIEVTGPENMKVIGMHVYYLINRKKKS